MFGGSYFGGSPFATPPGGLVRHLILRIAGMLGSGWAFARPSADTAAGDVGDGWQLGKPTGDISADSPGDDWQTGKPR